MNKKIWKDPVWSKVIAAIILAVLGLLYTNFSSSFPRVKKKFLSLFSYPATTTEQCIGLILVILICTLFLLAIIATIKWGYTFVSKRILEKKTKIKRLIEDYLIEKNKLLCNSEKEVMRIREYYGKRTNGVDIHSGAYLNAQKEHALKMQEEINTIFRTMKREIENIIGDINNFGFNASLAEQHKRYCSEYDQLKTIYTQLEKPVKKTHEELQKADMVTSLLNCPKT